MSSYNEEIKRKIDNPKIVVVENVGYDIWPFLYIINKINLDKYDYIIKLHTKRDMRAFLKNVQTEGNEWRRRLLNFVYSEENFKKTLKAFQKKEVGMVADHLIIYAYKSDEEKTLYSDVIGKMHEFGFEYDKKYTFVAGTMFMARAVLFKYLKYVYKQNDFTRSDEKHSVGLPHVIERLLGYSICAQGYKIVSFDGKNPDDEYRKMAVKNLFFKKIYTTNHIIIRVLGIPFFFKRK